MAGEQHFPKELLSQKAIQAMLKSTAAPASDSYRDFNVHPNTKWAINGFYPDVSKLKATAQLLKTNIIWGSWNGSDYNAGKLRIGPLQAGLLNKISFPIITSPNTVNQTIDIIAADSNATIGSIAVPENKTDWITYKIEFSPDSLPDKNQLLFLDFNDSGSQFGGWYAVALPKPAEKTKQ